MASRARSGSHLAVSVYANTSAPSNTITVSSTGDLVTVNALSVSGSLVGYVTNAYLQTTFAQNTAATGLASDKLQVANASALYVTKATALTTNNALVNLTSDRLQVANAAVTYVTKATALSSNSAVVNLVNDRLQVANAAVTYVTKAVHLSSNTAVTGLIDDTLQVANAAVTYVTKSVALTSNNALVNLINDRLQVANLTSSLSTYWPSANAIAYINANAGATDMTVNTSIFVASGGETSFAVPVTSNNNLIQVYLNGYGLTRSLDWTANSTHIKGMEALAAGDILQINEFKLHPANTLNRSAGGGGGVYQGSSFGYQAGDEPGNVNTIQKYSYTSDSDATDVGDLLTVQRYATAQSSSTNGYHSGGDRCAGGNVIQKYPFSTDSNATDVGDLTTGKIFGSGSSSIPAGYGYVAGGYCVPPFLDLNIIEKFPFSADSNGTDVGDLASCRYAATGHSSTTHGYIAAGRKQSLSPTIPIRYQYYYRDIEKYPFSSDTNASSIGCLIHYKDYGAGQSSDSYGYVTGGSFFGPGEAGNPTNVIQKFPFSSDGNATDVGDLVSISCMGNGTSSTSYGYHAGGKCDLPGTFTDTIQKFPFSSDANATDVANLLATAAGASDIGAQV